MTFLSPLLLLLAGASVVPLLIHLLRRRIGTRVEFPAARYLARAEQEHSRKLRLRNLLLMALRVLAVLLVAAAAARPLGSVGGSGHAPTALAVVLDNSLSTSVVVAGRPVLDRLHEAARELFAAALPGDRVWLVTADGAVLGGTPSSLADAAARVEALGGAGDLPGAVARAAALVRAAGLPARVVAVATDAQATAWPKVLSLGDVRVELFAPALRPPANHAVIEAEPRPPRWTPRGTVAARVQSADSSTYRVVLTGEDGAPRTLARGSAAPGEEVLVRAAPPERGWVAGAVELEPDELRGDDARYFAVWVGPAPAVAVDASAGPFARDAVDALRSAERVADGSDVLVAGADAGARLPALLFAPRDPVRVGAANRTLERLGLPWRLGAARRGEAAARGPRLERVTVTLRYALTRSGAAPADTVATVGAEPWIVAGERYVLVGSPLDTGATSLPVSAALVPLLDDLIAQRLSGEPGAALAAAPGATVSRPAWADAIELRSGERRPLSGDAFAAPLRPGVYFLIAGARRAGALVVNPEAEESLLDRLSARELRARVRAREVRASSTPSSWAAAAFDVSARRSLVAPALAAALLVLCVEGALAAGPRRRAA